MLIYSNENRGFIVNTQSRAFGGIYLSYCDETIDKSSKRPLYVIVDDEKRFIRMVKEKTYRKLLEDLKTYDILEPPPFNLNVFNIMGDFGISSIGLDLDLYLSYHEDTDLLTT